MPKGMIIFDDSKLDDEIRRYNILHLDGYRNKKKEFSTNYFFKYTWWYTWFKIKIIKIPIWKVLSLSMLEISI